MKNDVQVPVVSDFMNSEVAALSVNHNLGDAMAAFNSRRISSAPVIDERGEVVGMISEKNCLDFLAREYFFNELVNPSCSALMSKEVVALSPEMDISETLNLFRTHSLRHAPVVNAQGRLVGIVSRRDLMRTFEKLINERWAVDRHNLDKPALSIITDAKFRLELKR
jgi:CBS domain-containing protein